MGDRADPYNVQQLPQRGINLLAAREVQRALVWHRKMNRGAPGAELFEQLVLELEADEVIATNLHRLGRQFAALYEPLPGGFPRYAAVSVESICQAAPENRVTASSLHVSASGDCWWISRDLVRKDAELWTRARAPASAFSASRTLTEGTRLTNARSTRLFRVRFAVVSLLAGAAGAQPLAPNPPITDFVRRIHRDARGDLWLGTNGDGVIRRRGDTLEFFSTHNGFGGVAVRGIAEDEEGNVWFGTSGGLTKYDGASFTNYTTEDGLAGNDVWALTIDSGGTLWIGTLRGVSRFDGEEFTPFGLPKSEPDYSRGVTSDEIVHCIMEDSKGRIWFGNNAGAYVYDGETLANISERDGLCGNVVNCILEDDQGGYWFATHHNGVCRMDGDRFTHFTEEQGVQGTEVWDLYKDRDGNIWFPVEGPGVYMYDGETFTNFGEAEGLTTNAIQCTYEDDEGTLWLGGWTGLYRFDGDSFIHVTAEGPWE